MKWTLFFVATAIALPAYAEIPRAAKKYQRQIYSASMRHWGVEMGLQVPALLAAQVQAESAWKETARSKYAAGLSQFTPATGKEWQRRLHLSGDWAGASNELLMQAGYMRSLHSGVSWTDDPCDKYRWALHGYNAGPGWSRKEFKAGRCLRAHANCMQTHKYKQRIVKLAPEYIAAGWRGETFCR